MPESPISPDAPGPAEIVVHLDAEDHALLMAALRLLRSILGRDEADELARVEALLERLGSQRAA
jgi:hypothetical protein